MRALALAASALLLGSCATVVNGFNDEFVVETVPPGATVTTTLADRGGRATSCSPTPCSIPVSRKEQFIARITLPDHHDVRVVVRNSEFVRAEIDDERSMAEAAARESADSALATAGTGTAAVGLGVATGQAIVNTFGTYGFSGWAAAASFYAAPFAAGADGMTGAKLSLYPNPVKLVMVPDTQDVPNAYRFRSLPDDEELLVMSREGKVKPVAADKAPAP